MTDEIKTSIFGTEEDAANRNMRRIRAMMDAAHDDLIEDLEEEEFSFCCLVATGHLKYLAYTYAGIREPGITKRQAQAGAAALMRKQSVTRCIAALRAMFNARAIGNREYAIDVLQSIIEDDAASNQVKISAIKQMASMLGWDQPVKMLHEVGGNGGAPIRVDSETKAELLLAMQELDKRI